jgi:hypothetical protein
MGGSCRVDHLSDTDLSTALISLHQYVLKTTATESSVEAYFA